MVGILKNPLSKEQMHVKESDNVVDFRKQVYKNTQLNAKLTSGKNSKTHNMLDSDGVRAHVIPKDILSLKHEHDEEEKLQWNQKNLADNEIAKQQYQEIHVDETKTPYQGAVDPAGEYYKADDEDEMDGELNSFSLGEPEFEMKPVFNSQIEIDENLEDDNQEEDAKAKHKRFEEMRKKHYNVKEVFKSNNSQKDEDEEDDAE